MADALLVVVGWTEVKDSTDVIIFLVTVESVDLDWIWDFERCKSFKHVVDGAVLLEAGMVVCGCGGVKSHE